ncbi:MAG: GreA/GreB family elongation factor [Myxococcota bacterium]
MAGGESFELKRRLVAELLDRLRADHAALVRAQQATLAGATSEEAKPEHAKDTRALEQTYLARGQAQRVEELAEGLARVAVLPLRPFAQDEPIAVGALVGIEEDGVSSALLLVPYGGGVRLAGGEQVVTPASPLGRALLGRRPGDEVELRVGGRMRALVIRSVE